MMKSVLVSLVICVCVMQSLAFRIIWDDDDDECIKPWSRRKCTDVYDCCDDGRPVACIQRQCMILKDCLLKGTACDYDEECCRHKCKEKNGKKICVI